MKDRDVRRLLGGYGDGSYDGPLEQDSDEGEVAEVGSTDKWMLYRPRDMLSLIPPEMVITYDATGCVARVWIVD